MTGGEIALVLFVFALIYLAGLLPRIAARLSGNDARTEARAKPEGE
jgi:hypothetical protein